MFTVLDIEASSLLNGYPLEIGWAREDGVVGAVLIKPHEEWDALHWDPVAQQIHGLSPDILERDGMSAVDAFAYLNSSLSGCRCASDAPSADWRWLSLLHEFADRPELTFTLLEDDAEAIIVAQALHDVFKPEDRAAIGNAIRRTQIGRPHSAAGDAVRWMAALEVGRGQVIDEIAIGAIVRKWDERAAAAMPWRAPTGGRK